MSEALLSGIEYKDEEWPHGLRCGECHRLIQEPERYSEQLDGFIGEYPVCRILCVPCATDRGVPA